MKSTEWTTKITAKPIEDAIKLIVENHDSKSTVLISKDDARQLIGDLNDAISEL